MTPSNRSSRFRNSLLQHLSQKLGSKRARLDKGFTLVELIIVMVIVAVLAAIALPLYRNQTLRAKATECNVKTGAILTQVGAEYSISPTDATTLLGTLVTDANSDSENCTWTAEAVSNDAAGVAAVYNVSVDGDGELANGTSLLYAANGCINGITGVKDIDYQVAPSGGASAQPSFCT